MCNRPAQNCNIFGGYINRKNLFGFLANRKICGGFLACRFIKFGSAANGGGLGVYILQGKKQRSLNI